MKLHYILFFLSGLTVFSCSNDNKNYNQSVAWTHGIIPLPKDIQYSKGTFSIDEKTAISNDPEFASAAKVLSTTLTEALQNWPLTDYKAGEKTTIQFIKNDSLSNEGYILSISDKGITLAAKTRSGAFYAAQTLSQMIRETTRGLKQKSFTLKNVIIKDSPKYAWRGFHLDVSRHFFSKEYIIKIIDWLSYYKINKLHLHLSDDQGWRVEIEQYPLLTETGAWRPFNNWDSICMEKSKSDTKFLIDARFIKQINGKTMYGGFFTKQDLKEIINYAEEHCIDVIPEIDMPGHMSAAILSYPFLSCTGTAGWGNEFSYPICPCKEDVMNFCRNVWNEMTELFQYPVVHIGSDEVEKDTWAASSECENFMRQNNLHNLNEIQNYFVTTLQRYLESKGKKVIAWDDVIDGKVDNNLIIMYWRDWLKDSPSRCAANGNTIILTPMYPFYISGEHTDKTLEDLYNYIPEEIFPPEVTSKVIGVQSCVWTEVIPSESMFEYLVFPRVQALSEVAWSGAHDWNSFKARLKLHFMYMSSKGINYRRPTWLN